MEKVLVANRGEIAVRVFRACTELGIKTVGIYAEEDEYSVHRFKADEAYLIGQGKKPIDAYLDIEGIISIAKQCGADAIHPGYGLLSENLGFAQRCKEEGITFVGPDLHHLDIFGDKIKAKAAAIEAGIASIPGTDGPIASVEEALDFGERYGYPIMIKAALGGGGRGMRVAHDEKSAREGYERAKSEAKAAFGSDEVYVEKYIANPKHIEVQILGDKHGNVIHLFERDCSVQRRHQKVVEVAPCVSMNEEQRQRICEAAVQLMKHVGYVNAGTVEFLVEGDDFYFIEVNPRVQVEHTITEMITDVDIVTTQLLIAQGKDLHKEIGLPEQSGIKLNGSAIQCRITTEDPLNHFLPDTGKIDTYRSPGGFGVRLDVGNAYSGYVVTPYFDSLLVKVCTHAADFDTAIQKMTRCLKEFRIRGVKTNIPFMLNVISHPVFQSGNAKTTFIDNTKELFEFPRLRDRGNKTMKYIGEITVNGFPGIKKGEKPFYDKPRLPKKLITRDEYITAKNVLDNEGADGLVQWIKNQENLLLTDTTFRDAHQSLLATRVRTKDFKEVARLTGEGLPELFSSEMWGGATFDVAYRFLNEDPWQRLRKIRSLMPNTLLQMLFRGSNAVGYSNYPDNVLVEFVKEAAAQGIDVFRIFDSLNWTPQMEKSIQAATKAGVDIVDVAMSAMSGNTSQPSMSSLYYALVNGPRLPEINIQNAQQLNHYWEDVRMYYKPFENGLNAPETEVYMHEMPGGQYSNLQQQAKAVGLGHKWDEIKQMYHTVNLMFGDIVKVTPSSKVVGDMALFMVQNDLTEDDIYEKGDTLSFPESVVTFFQGELGQPVGGFPEKLQKIILKGRPAINVRPGALAEPVDFEQVKNELAEKIGYEPKNEEVLSYLMYPQVFLDYQKAYNQFGDVTLLDTPTFFQGIRLGETVNVQIERGKILIIRLDEIGEPDIEGNRVLFFNLNGQRREILIKDTSIISSVQTRLKAEPTNREQIGATMSGSVLEVLVKKGDKVKKGDTLMITEAMKMETAIEARFDGEIAHIYVANGDSIASGDLLIEVTEK